MSTPSRTEIRVEDVPAAVGIRLTRRELGMRFARALLAGGAAYAGRSAARSFLVEVGYGGTGHGALPALARRLFRFWDWGKRWRR